MVGIDTTVSAEQAAEASGVQRRTGAKDPAGGDATAARATASETMSKLEYSGKRALQQPPQCPRQDYGVSRKKKMTSGLP